jgi:hypothetical protein
MKSDAKSITTGAKNDYVREEGEQKRESDAKSITTGAKNDYVREKEGEQKRERE